MLTPALELERLLNLAEYPIRNISHLCMVMIGMAEYMEVAHNPGPSFDSPSACRGIVRVIMMP